jgi:hypothetical protein
VQHGHEQDGDGLAEVEVLAYVRVPDEGIGVPEVAVSHRDSRTGGQERSVGAYVDRES